MFNFILNFHIDTTPGVDSGPVHELERHGLELVGRAARGRVSEEEEEPARGWVGLKDTNEY